MTYCIEQFQISASLFAPISVLLTKRPCRGGLLGRSKRISECKEEERADSSERSQPTIDELSELARLGNADAIAAVMEEVVPSLGVVARRISNGLIDPEDLQSTVLENLLRLWSRGKGPANGVFPYLVRAMRNRVIDEARSPRSGVYHLGDEEISDPAVDLDRELEMSELRFWVSSALNRVPSAQRKLLLEIDVDGRKPAELVQAYNKSPNAIYSLHRRAKISFKRALLMEFLLDGAPQECREAIADFPANVTSSLEPQRGGSHAAIDHIRYCARCGPRWEEFWG